MKYHISMVMALFLFLPQPTDAQQCSDCVATVPGVGQQVCFTAPSCRQKSVGDSCGGGNVCVNFRECCQNSFVCCLCQPMAEGSPSEPLEESECAGPTPAVPAVSDWGLLIFFLAFFTTGSVVFQRLRQTTAV